MGDTREWQIGAWVFDAPNARLISADREIALEHRAARTLELLCRHRGDPVSRDKILADVWDGRSVSANSVAIVIGDLRRALGDDVTESRLITTIPKRGYRLANDTRARPSPFPTSGRRRIPLGAAIASLLLIASATFYIARPIARNAHVTVVLARITNDTGDTRYQPLAAALQELVTNKLVAMHVELVSPASPPHDTHDDTLWLRSRLILWTGIPTLSMQASDNKGHVTWTAMAVAPQERLATATIAKLATFEPIVHPRR
uniref:winged helix-turn-helix domain-containing protein n=1 Tax=uncultured Sphingomonas sp. TaxID=158754 RepID=UPI0035C9CF57